MANPGPMACPVDGAALVMSERSGIEIDYCPACRGVWLDRGELDKIIERSDRFDDDRRPTDAGARPEHDRDRDRDRDRHYDRDRQYPHHKRKSFWHELFD